MVETGNWHRNPLSDERFGRKESLGTQGLGCGWLPLVIVSGDRKRHQYSLGTSLSGIIVKLLRWNPHCSQRRVVHAYCSISADFWSRFPSLVQARFYWRPGEDDAHGAGSCVISICDVDFKYRFEYLGCKVTQSLLFSTNPASINTDFVPLLVCHQPQYLTTNVPRVRCLSSLESTRLERTTTFSRTSHAMCFVNASRYGHSRGVEGPGAETMSTSRLPFLLNPLLVPSLSSDPANPVIR